MQQKKQNQQATTHISYWFTAT